MTALGTPPARPSPISNDSKQSDPAVGIKSKVTHRSLSAVDRFAVIRNLNLSGRRVPIRDGQPLEKRTFKAVFAAVAAMAYSLAMVLGCVQSCFD